MFIEIDLTPSKCTSLISLIQRRVRDKRRQLAKHEAKRADWIAVEGVDSWDERDRAIRSAIRVFEDLTQTFEQARTDLQAADVAKAKAERA